MKNCCHHAGYDGEPEMEPARALAAEVTNPGFLDARVVPATEAPTAELPVVIAWPGEGDLELAEATFSPPRLDLFIRLLNGLRRL